MRKAALLVLVLFTLSLGGCMCAQKLTQKQALNPFEEIENSVNRSGAAVEEFERLLNISLDNTSIEDMAEAMLGSAEMDISDTFNKNGVSGAIAKVKYGSLKVMALQFPDTQSASMYMNQYISAIGKEFYNVENHGYDESSPLQVERLKYEDNSVHAYRNIHYFQSNVYLLQKGVYLFIVIK